MNLIFFSKLATLNLCYLVLIISVSFSVSASEVVKSQLVDELLELNGDIEYIRMQQEEIRKTYKQPIKGREIYYEIQYGKLPNSFYEEELVLRDEFNAKVDAIAEDMNSKVLIWKDKYVANFTENELKQILDFFKSEIGKKYTNTRSFSEESWFKEINKIWNNTMAEEHEKHNYKIRELLVKYKNVKE